tara:strand:- start:462 stop:722 length:261 start_codon:yes stop_codon:yes gene_type:complete
MRVADYIAKYLKSLGVRDVFMLTGYGAMYLNDAIKLSGIKYYATRNEATAPIMAESYARIKKNRRCLCNSRSRFYKCYSRFSRSIC